MMTMWFLISAFQAAVLAGTMACFLLFRPHASFSHRSLAGIFVATALANFANGAGLLDENHALYWRALAMVAELVQPAALLYVGLAFLSPADAAKDVSSLWRARIIGGISILLSVIVA